MYKLASSLDSASDIGTSKLSSDYLLKFIQTLAGASFNSSKVISDITALRLPSINSLNSISKQPL